MSKLEKFPCPGCGELNTATRRWSGELECGREGEYQGLWIECCSCGLQGPKKVWMVMAQRRKMIQRSLGVEEQESGRQRGAYIVAIEDFGQKMFAELIANDEKKGNFLAWNPDKEGAISELEHHFVKLVAALNRESRLQVSEYCADLANTAMGIEAVLGVVEHEDK